MTETGQDVTLYAGDDKALLFTISDEGGDPLDLTGYALSFVMRGPGFVVAVAKSTVSESDPDSGGIEVVSAEDGTLRVTLTHSDTADLAPVEHPYQLEGTDGSGNVSTLAAGTVTVLRSVAP